MTDAEYITRAERMLERSRTDKVVARAKSYALDSIAASLIVLARNSLPVTVEAVDAPLTRDDVELMFRRLHDDVKVGGKPKTS